MTPTGCRLVAVITVLSLAHHADHVLRDVTGWPFDGGFNPFSASLFVYPVIAAGVVLSRRGKAGPAFWTALAAGGAAFILVVHVGPAAGDAVGDIPGQYDSPAADVIALAILAALFVALVVHATYEIQRRSRTDHARNPG